MPERLPPSSSAAGSATERFRPMKSLRPAVYAVTGSVMPWNAVHPLKCESK
jgi:hypothetical protein